MLLQLLYWRSFNKKVSKVNFGKVPKRSQRRGWTFRLKVLYARKKSASRSSALLNYQCLILVSLTSLKLLWHATLTTQNISQANSRTYQSPIYTLGKPSKQACLSHYIFQKFFSPVLSTLFLTECLVFMLAMLALCAM